MPIQPADIAKQLFERLSLAAGSAEVLDDLEIRRLEREAQKLMKADAWKAHQVLGALAAIKWDVEGVRAHHEASLKLRASGDAYRNYATSLQLVGQFHEAAEAIRTASERQPENITWLRTAIDFTLWEGEVTKAIDLEHEFEKRAPNHESSSGILNRLLAFIERQRISEGELQRALGVAFSLLQKRRQRFKEVELSLDDDQDTAFFSILINRPTKEVLALDAELGEAFAREMPDLCPALVIQLETKKSPAPNANVGQAARST